MINSHLLSNRTGHEPVGVGSSNLSTSVTRDFKSLASGALKGYEGSNPTLTAKRSPLQGDAYRSNWLKANWSTPGFHPGNRGSKPLGDTKASYQQKAVEKAIYPRISSPALRELSTHKQSRFGLKARISSPAFTHKQSRLYDSRLCDNWSTANPLYLPVLLITL